MAKRRVLLLRNGSLLMAAVRQLLQQEGRESLDLQWVAPDDPEAAARIVRFAPEAIVLDAGEPSGGRECVARLLANLPGTRGIALKLEQTDLEVYRTERVSEASLDGLLAAIQGEPARHRPGKIPLATSRPRVAR